MIVGVITAYLLTVLAIGALSHRLLSGTREDYFVASRTIDPFLLLMSLFGTNMTAFSILGASGEAYSKGVGVFGLMASSSAIVIPAIFFFVGTRDWQLGQKHGYVTQAQFLRDRFQSDTVGLLVFIVLTMLVIPYLLIGVMGGRYHDWPDNGRRHSGLGWVARGLCRGHDIRLFRRAERDCLGERVPDDCFHGVGCRYCHTHPVSPRRGSRGHRVVTIVRSRPTRA